MDWKQEFMKELLPYLVATVGGLLSLALWALRSWATEKAKESKLARALSTLPIMAEAIYKDVEAGMKEEIDAAVADGTITGEEFVNLRAEAVKELKLALPKHGLGALKDAFGPALESVLEKVVGSAQARLTTSGAALTVGDTSSPQ